uniref:GIN domain-containing protein n=1 Tax=Flavobacterium sp. TaxID=239 RepID=UPI004049C301
MKKITLLLLIVLSSTLSIAQKKEKIKGSKIITHSIKKLENFENIDVEDNLEIYLVKADSASLEIEADDNLHDIINYTVLGNTLRINSLKDVYGEKKFSVRINYNNNLKLITAKHDTKIHALIDLELENITIKNYDNSRSFLNVKSTNFAIILNDKSEAELNVKANNTIIEVSKDAELKALIASPEVKIDIYQKGKVEIEGDAAIVKARIDNNSNLIAKKFTIASLDITAENYAKASINVTKNIKISAAGKSEIELLGDPKIEIVRFTNNTTLYKKEK